MANNQALTPSYLGIEQFDSTSDTWESYAERLIQSLKLHAVVGEEKQVAALLTSMGGATYKLLKDLVAPTKPETLTFDAICKRLKEHYSPKPLTIAERFRYNQRNQTADETVSQYLADLRRLASTCEFGNHLDEVLRDRFVCGLRSDQQKKRLLSEDGLTLTKAVELASSMEMADRDVHSLHHNGSSTAQSEVNYTSSNRKATSQRGGQSSSHNGKAPSTPCPRCGGTGHWGSHCQHKTSKCFNCNNTGHLSKMCRKPRRPNQMQHDE